MEAHRRSCFTPPEAAGGHYRETAKEDVLAVSRALKLALFMDANSTGRKSWRSNDPSGQNM
jgi:hypothetical protein